MENKIKVLVADDHELLRDGLVKLLSKLKDISVVAQACNGREMTELAEKFLPDVILADIKMEEMDGVEATAIITKKHPEIRVIAYSMIDNSYLIADMIAAGAKGYLLKGAAKAEIIEGIRAVYANKDYYCNGATEIMHEALRTNRLASGVSIKEIRFTKREKQMMPLLCQGLSTIQISKQMFLSPSTVDNYRTSLLQKTGCKNTAHFVFFIIQHNIFKP